MSFRVTDTDIQVNLLAQLPSQYSPYVLYGTYAKKVHVREYASCYIEADVKDFYKLRHENIWQFFIRSKVISPQVMSENNIDVDALFSLSGYINLQHGLVQRGLFQESSLCMVDEIINSKNFAVYKHSEYLALFNAMKSLLRPILKLKSVMICSKGGHKKSATKNMSSAYGIAIKESLIKANVIPDVS